MIIITWVITSRERFNDRNLTLYVITNETKKYLALWMSDIVIHNTSWNRWYNSFNLLRVVWHDDFLSTKMALMKKRAWGPLAALTNPTIATISHDSTRKERRSSRSYAHELPPEASLSDTRTQCNTIATLHR